MTADLSQLTQSSKEYKTHKGISVKIRPLTLESLGSIIQAYRSSIIKQTKAVIEQSGLSGQDKVQFWRDVIKEVNSINLIDNPNIFTSPEGMSAMIREAVGLPDNITFEDFLKSLHLSETAELCSEIASISGLTEVPDSGKGNSNVPFPGSVPKQAT